MGTREIFGISIWYDLSPVQLAEAVKNSNASTFQATDSYVVIWLIKTRISEPSLAQELINHINSVTNPRRRQYKIKKAL